MTMSSDMASSITSTREYDESDPGRRRVCEWVRGRSDWYAPEKFFVIPQGDPPVDSANALEVRTEPDGSVIVSDRFGAAYARAETFQEAFQGWLEEAGETRKALESEEGALHPRLTKQLQFLRVILGS